MNNIEPDLTSFSSLLGDSFSSKINLLSQILQNAHYPSLGRYKENLLIKLIKEYLPSNYEVASGFVMFVHTATDRRALKPGFDELNMGSYSLSRQCDIIIYDSSSIPIIFKDEDFVIVRPECVKAIIEVKSSANKKEVDKILDLFYDFGKKWRECQLFYKKHHQKLSKRPSLYAMCWEIPKNKNNKNVTNGKLIREQISKFYKEKMNLNELQGFPLLNTLHIYNECSISQCIWFSENDKLVEGYITKVGKFIRHDINDTAYIGGDSTISSLLASLHYSISNEDFNRFYSYTKETKEIQKIPYEYYGLTEWLTDEKYLKHVNFEYVEEEEK